MTGEDPTFFIRTAGPGDAPALVRLLAQLDAFHAQIQPAFFRRGARGEEEVRQLIAGSHSVILVAEEGRVLLGATTLRAFNTPDHPLMVPSRRVLLEDMVVDSAARRRGIGAALVDAAREWATRQEAGQLLLTVWEGNGEARRFYQAVGLLPVSQVMGLTLE